MSKLPFEEFLAGLFCQFITTSNSIDTKYHFISSNPAQSLQLYNGFKKMNFKSLTVGNSALNYIEAENGKKIIVMLHHLGEQDNNSSHEDYIASIRDALNDIQNAVLFVINNSSLETLTSTFTDVSVGNSVFTPKYVNNALIEHGKGIKDELIFKYLVNSTEQKIKDQNLSIFGYEPLYKSIHKERIDLKEHGLFPEPRLSDINDEKELKKELDKNASLSKIIYDRVHDFEDDPVELQRQLEDKGFSERFIKDQFIGKNQNEYKNRTFSEIEAEIEKNKDRNLELVDIEVNGQKLEEWKRLSENGPSRKSISLIGELKPNVIEIKIRMTRGEPLLKSEQVTFYGDLNKNQVSITNANHEQHSTLNIKFPFDGKPTFLQIKIKRPSQRECFQFNCCFVEKDTFYLQNFFEKLEVEIKRNRGKLILENIQDKITLNPESPQTHTFTGSENEINCEDIKEIDFRQSAEENVLGDFQLVLRDYHLPITITGKKVIESVKLPSLFDTQRSKDIFDNDRIPKYKPSNSRVIVSGREKELSVKAKELCIDEYKIISEGILYFDDSPSNMLDVKDIEKNFPKIAQAYKSLFSWLMQNETLISITNWPPELLNLLESTLLSIKSELDDIPQEALSQRSRDLLKIGMFKKGNEELFSPFHPVCMAYALEFAKLRNTDQEHSFSNVPPTTIDKFNAAGLLPILFDENEGFVRTQALGHNRLWLEVVPQKESGNKFVSTLVHEKIQDFVTCFDMLFQQSKNAPLIINSINNQKNTHVFKGIVSYFKKAKGKAKKIQVNVYDDEYYTTSFEEFSESRKLEELRELVRLSNSDKEAVLDDLIFKIRRNVTVHKVREFTDYAYAHLSFFKNNEEVTLRSNNVNEGKSGIVCNGVLSGEASYLENEVFYTGFGLKNVKTENFAISLASQYNQLLFAYRDKSAKYIKGNVPVLAVKDTFRDKLSKSYDSSLWTCIIDPKVTLEFFDTKDTILIHYADQYTNSVAYDAITVSSRVGLYKDLLQSQSDQLINSFNALNGQWLLSIVKESGKKKTENTKKQIKEKQGIVAAYKFLSSLLITSDITWIPLSVGEMLRVTGNLGLEIKDNDFAARLHNKTKGALSDDILFVGIKGEQLVLLPLEVKTRKQGTDFTKAVKQVKALADHMKRLLEPKTLKGKVYRSLFIQQVLTQIDKFELYDVFPEGYFSSIRNNPDILLQGDYDICDLSNYPEGVALAVNEGMERSRIETELDKEVNVLKLRLPQEFVKMIHENSIAELSKKYQKHSDYPEISKLSLLKAELTTFMNQPLLEVKDDSSVITATNIDTDTTETIQDHGVKEDQKEYIVKFDYPEHLERIVEKILSLYQKDITATDVFSLSENDLEESKSFESSDILSFYRLREVLLSDRITTITEQKITGDDSAKLITINVTNEYRALVNTLLKEFGENITVNQVMEIGVPSLDNINGFGKTKVNRFFEFINHLKQGSFSITNQDDSPQQIDNFDLPLDELEEHLINDLNDYFQQEKNRETDILSRRLGINCDSETLEEIGKSYDITRERIRQIESKAKKNFIARLSISPRVIWAITKTNLSELRAPLFPRLRDYFNVNKNFYSFLEVCCGLKENEIKIVTSPNLNKSVFEEFWVWHKSPANIEDLSWYLHENMNIELAVAENQISIWIQDGILELNNEEIKPLALSKVPGITNALLDFPSGDVWQNIQNHANSKKIISGDFFTDRPEPSLGYGADKEYLYQSARGTYRHLAYLNISENDKQRVLDIVLSKLNEHKHAGRESVNLSVDIYQRLGLSDDYYIVRHIIRAYGESKGIYFNGKSGADTVSLASNFNLASQKTVLIDLFKQSLKPLSKKFVASKIRSQSLGHASFYLDKLLTDGDIVRIDEMHYSHKDNAFISVDIEGTLNLAFSFIDREVRIIEGEKIQSHLNRHLDKEYNKYFYISLLKAHAAAFGRKYYFIQNLISNNEIEYSGLSDICREALDNSTTREAALEFVKEKVCVHEHVLKRSFDQISIGNSKNTPSPAVKNDNESVISPIDVKIEANSIYETTTKTNSPPELTKEVNIESCRVLIGQAIDNQKPVYWEYGNKNLANRHLIVFGRSGQGKTYCIQGLLMEMAKAHCNSLVIDYTNGFLPNHLEDEFSEFVNPQSHFLAQKPLGLSPFRKQKQDFGGVILEEQNHIVAGRIASVFNQVYSSIGEQQLATLMNVLEDGVRRHSSKYDFECMLDDLREEGKVGEALANKLSPMVKSKLFDSNSEQSWQSIFGDEKSKTNIIQLASLSRDIMQLATEFTLWDLYAYACSYGNKSNPLPIVLDEVQNLDHRLESPLGKMLTEGRKYGLSLILATQTLSMLSKDEQDRLFQASHKLFFAPAETEIQSYAKLLEQAVPGTNRKAWLDELAKLKKGECISVGLHMNEYGVVEQGARVVKVSLLSERI
ncbi:DNA phosphorothioation-dependent restriction protein DptH [Aliiglaciecola sp. 3_MG-2023]|uniref:DNA phosphorothioation-dependent restriction protein DptH n=1 Tax=Aliiglaciecola sp. 3_MG-2023 TaxID=3062644 RepID=UPI0026E41334|nr:DNA phosphorothioation-dependent restriction protein DptH [Aliiglaciecola sp. 3_MG-2023]MDO6694528.1 DNA phosphorothioation-dependent restriction protein DptH [Aliiglaciecola sp. 3_MG-2023]